MKRALFTLMALVLVANATDAGVQAQPQPAVEAQFGVNLAGAEFGSTFPGTHGTDYIYPSDTQLDYYKSKNLTLIRLPFSWERVQHNLNGPLDTTELARIDAVIAGADTRGMKIILDVHNYGRYNGQIIGSSSVPNSAFRDLWQKLAAHYKGQSAVWAYGLMNEPHSMQGGWPAAAQAGVDGVRTSDMSKVILVSGDNWSGAWSWASHSADLWVTDPANNVVYEAHQYFDKDGSGTYVQSYDADGAYPTIGVDRAKPFVEWLKERGARGFIGEFGVPDNDPRWLTVMDDFMAYLSENGVGGTYWAGGPWWGNYPLSVEPREGRDRPQMQVLTKHVGGSTPEVEPTPVVEPTPIAEPTPTLDPTPVPVHPASLILYDNEFRNGFVDGTFNFRARNTCNKRYVVSALCSYAVTLRGYGGINFIAPTNSFDASGYTALEWYVRPGRTPLSSLSALMTDRNGKVIREVRLSSRYVTEKRPGGWIKVSIPLVDLNPNGGTIATIQLKNATSGNLLTLYIDEVRLVR
jgi:endoglucanase